MIAIAIRTLVVSVANVEVKVGLSAEGVRGLATPRSIITLIRNCLARRR
jgi:hypothetical protein